MEPCSSLTESGLAAFIAPSDPAYPDSRSLAFYPTDCHTYSTAPLLSLPAVCAWPGLHALCINARSAAPTNSGPGTAVALCGGFISSLLPSTRNCTICVSLNTAHCVITAPNDVSSSTASDHCANNLCGYCPHPYWAARASVRFPGSGTSGRDAMPNNLKLSWLCYCVAMNLHYISLLLFLTCIPLVVIRIGKLLRPFCIIIFHYDGANKTSEYIEWLIHQTRLHLISFFQSVARPTRWLHLILRWLFSFVIFHSRHPRPVLRLQICHSFRLQCTAEWKGKALTTFFMPYTFIPHHSVITFNSDWLLTLLRQKFGCNSNHSFKLKFLF